MPILLYFVVVGSTLFGLLLGVDAMLPPVSPAIVSSNFYGLPPPLRATPEVGDRAVAPAPDMSSPQVLAAMPKEPVASVAQIAAREPPKRPKHVARKPLPPDHRISQAWNQGWNQGWNQDAPTGGWNRDRSPSWRNHYASDLSAQRESRRPVWRGFP